MKNTVSIYLLPLALFMLIKQEVQADMIDSSSLQPWEVCGMCHGLNGISAMEKFPVLAGQSTDYIEKQFYDFKFGHRTNDGGQMQTISTEIAESDISVVANYFNKQIPRELDSSENKALWLLGKTIFYHNRENAPACYNCHSNENTNTPNLVGQHESYLQKQLQEFKTGLRSNDDGRLMQFAVKNLNDNEIRAVSHFLSHREPKLTTDLLQPRTQK